jgi:hypothetical protein
MVLSRKRQLLHRRGVGVHDAGLGEITITENIESVQMGKKNME